MYSRRYGITSMAVALAFAGHGLAAIDAPKKPKRKREATSNVAPPEGEPKPLTRQQRRRIARKGW